ncbi:lytic murein transglycosylase B [Agitococcus lubricus]|uniref:Membrane-bound lytic murein transglycosylase B n=1 Tax=Agitococcus lubricus TaxID=1077255 RepID=A0A2T5J1S8_9GAMM|nr:lytic murein transglycosylase B [Agitococcus lubricus]PTQ90396.1 membrane-bound lytic murein transglycosylase B [Agitococcus lubricus]
MRTTLLCLLAVLSCPLQMATAGDFDNYEELQALISSMEREGIYPEGELTALFSMVKRQNKALDAIARPAEKTKEWKDYKNQFLSAERINNGVEFWQRYNKALNLASEQYGVPPEIIVAIIGVETKYGANKGNFKVLDALTSLAFDYPPRAPFFRKELRTFLQLAKEQNLNPLETYGSYAGAMGFGQFMPSSWRNLAVDFDADGKIDLLNNPIDAIGSVANYFKANGWQTGLPVVSRAKIIADNYDDAPNNKDLKAVSTLNALSALGLVPRDTVKASDLAVNAIRLQGDNGAEFWLAFDNFYVITRYNRSLLYAMAVFQLSESIKEVRNQFKIGTDAFNLSHTPVNEPISPSTNPPSL